MNGSMDAARNGRPSGTSNSTSARRKGWARRVVMMAVPAVLATLAFAEPKPVDPYYVIVSGDKAPLVCMPNDSAYTVAEVKSGTVLRVDADDARWARVEYPTGAKAYVRADDGVIENGKLRLTNATKLFARNQVKGGGGSWKAVFDVELPIGTILDLSDPQTEKQGELVIGYNVIAPAGAKGFLESKGLRRATQAEVDGAKNAGGLVDAPAVAPSGGGVSPTGVDLTKPANPSTTTATKPTTEATKTADATTPGTITSGGGTSNVTATPAVQGERRIGDMKQLEAAFAEVVKQPVMTAEFGELIVEFQRAIDATSADKPTFKKQLQQRLDYLNLRKEYQASMLAAEDARKTDQAMADKLKSAFTDLEASRIYTMIGTLQPSTVYDGSRLPKMYRVQSVGDVNPRTLGYITPNDELSLDGKVGQVVGIVGDAQLDPGLRLNVIKPVRVDTLKPGESKVITPAPTADKDTPAADLNK